MEEWQADQEDSAIEHATGSSSYRLPAGPPDVANLEDISLPVDQITSAGVLEPLSQYPEDVIGAKNHEDVAGCKKSQVPKLKETELQSRQEKNKTECNIFTNENQAQEIYMQEAPLNSVELIHKIKSKVLNSSSQDIEIPGKIDNHKTECKKSKFSKSTIIEVRPNSGKMKKKLNVSVDENKLFARETSELYLPAKMTSRALGSSLHDLESFETLNHHEIVTSYEKSKNRNKMRCDVDRDNFDGAFNEIVSLDESNDGDFDFTMQPKMAEGSKHVENDGFSGKVTTLSATDLKSRLDMEFFDPAEHVEVIFSRDGTSKLAGGSTGSLGETSSRKRNENLWHVVTGRLCRGFRKCNWFPKMCSCLEGGSPMSGQCSTGRAGSYERLGSGPTLFEFSSLVQRARRRAANKADESVDNEKQAELTFYNDDLTGTRVCVEKNLRTMDLCELLKVKKNATGNAWSIVETWPELGIERTLEDHEDILATHREMEMFASHHERKFYFRNDFLKYEFFISPKQFFPAEMVAFPIDEDRGSSSDVEETLRNYLARNDAECPQVFSLVWIRDESSSTWKKTHMLLQGRKLYTTKKAFLPSTKFLRSRLTPQKALLTSKTNCSHHKSMSPDHVMSSPDSPSSSTSSRSFDTFHHSNAGALPKRTLDHDQPSPLAHLSDYYVYKIPNAKRYFNAPFEWGACLRPSSNAEAEDTEAGVPGLKVIAFTSEKSRACWLTAMRLAKYGKQLRENYRAFRNKQCEQNGGGSPKEQYSSYNVPNESLRSRVAMDFTGSVGRIVEDPKEAKDIAESEGIIWRRRWRPFSRPPPGCAMVRLHGLDGGIHVLQPWFHSGLNRDIAAAIIKEHGSVDGVFLVRESKSNPGAYVLTYKYSEKVFHAQIQPIFDERRNCWLYTLDKGATKFYDLLQLIEFYQLNSGSLPTRLTHYVQNGVTVAQQRQEDGGASPSPPFSANQNMSPKSDCPKSSSGI